MISRKIIPTGIASGESAGWVVHIRCCNADACWLRLFATGCGDGADRHCGGIRGGHCAGIQNAVRDSHCGRSATRVQPSGRSHGHAEMGDRSRLHARAGSAQLRPIWIQAGFTLFTPLVANDVTDQRNAMPNVAVYRSDNRSSYNALMIHLQGNVARRFSLIANYLAVEGGDVGGCWANFSIFDGVCNPLNPFGPGGYGPSGEDVRHRFVLAGTFHVPGSSS